MTTFLTVLVVLGLCWLVALEIRYHGLKSVVAESKQLADEAASIADNAIAKLRDFISAHEKAAAKPKPKAKR